MDKTYNDLMDIVNRTKKVSGGSDTPRVTRRVPREEPMDEAVDTVRVVKPAKDLDGESKSVFAGRDAINKFLNKSKEPKKTEKKKTTETKKKTTTKKEPAEKKAPAKKVEKPAVAPVAPTNSNIDMNDPKNIELYNALKGTLFAGGTDISEYVDDNKYDNTINNLKSLKEKKRTEIINEEITKEQQEYEKLFTGSFFSEEAPAVEEEEEDNAPKINPEAFQNSLASIKQITKEKRLEKDLEEIKSRDIEIDRKIADYYKQKQEKINKYNEALYSEDNYEEKKPTDSYEDKQHAYEDIFSGQIMSRAELMGEPVEKEEPQEEEEETPVDNTPVETEVVETEEPADTEENNEEIQESLESNVEVEESVNEEVSEENEKSEKVESQEESETTEELEETAEVVDTEEVQENNSEIQEDNQENLTEFQKIYQTLKNSAPEETDSVVAPKEEIDTIEEIEDKAAEESIEEENTQETTEAVETESEEVVDSAVETEDTTESEDNPFAKMFESMNAYSNDESEQEETETAEVVEESNAQEITETPVETEIETEEVVTKETAVADTEPEVVENTVEETESEEVPVIDEEKDDKESEAFIESVEETLYGDDSVVEEETEEVEEIEEPQSIEEKFERKMLSEDNIYDLSGDDGLDDYILSSNVPDEIELAPVKETPLQEYIEEDNSLVLDTRALPESIIDVMGKKFEPKVEEKKEEIEEKEEDDTISKEEFYNEMARLQENLINELKGQKVENTQGKDFFEEKPKKEEEKSSTIDKALDIINNLTNKPAEEETPVVETAEAKNDSDDEKASELVNDIINHIEKGDAIENIVDPEEETVSPEDAEKFESMDLLNKEVALNEEDLKFFDESQKPRDFEKDACFYMSDEDKNKKAEFEDEYLNLYNEEESGHNVEVGDINLNKDIQNAIPLSEMFKNNQKAETEVDDEEEEMETIYTLFGMERKKMGKTKEDIKVLYVASECQPFIATGGLADVAGSLPKEVAKLGGVDIRVIMPLYGNIKAEHRDEFEYLGNFTVHLSWRQEYCGLFRYSKDGVTYYFIDNERYFKRDKTYGYYDDGERFAYFCKAIVESLPVINFWPDIIHCNDWQSALVSTYIKTGNWSDFRYYKIKNIYTIHNVEYQGVYGMENLKDLFGIDWRFRNDMDYNGDINLTKAAIQFSDKFTTVSESYCDNLKQPYCSRGLHHIIIRNEYKLSGIINGIDYDFYNPETDKIIYKNYTVDTMKDKVMNKKIWQDELGLPVDSRTPMLAIVSRLVSHKGLDLVSKVMEDILQKDIQLVVVGTGDQRFVDYYKYLEDKYPTKVRAMVDKFSSELARKAYGASDIFIMPSKIEPCGISQMIASRYGSIPVVRETGGLKDSIKDFGCPEGGNGYTFTNYNPNDLKYQIERAIEDYEDQPNWEKKMRIAMTTDFRWSKSAEKYIELYKSLV